MKTPKKIAIVALGPSSGNYIQDVDKAGDRFKLFDETWTFNSYCSVIESDRLFHMDDVLVQERRARAGNQRVAGMLEAMKRYKGPIYTSFAEPAYPTMVDYPLGAIAQKYNSLYFTSTPPYALAYAGLIGVEEAWLYGMDYTWPDIAGAERGRACMEYWVGRVMGLGMRIRVAKDTSLLDTSISRRSDIKLYGYDRAQVALHDVDEKTYELRFAEKELPTAEEIEERYSHLLPGSGVALDVVN